MRTASLAFALFFAVPLWSSGIQVVDPCELYLREFWSVTHFEPTSYWDSDLLRNRPLRDQADGVSRGQTIAKHFFNRDSALWLETIKRMPRWFRDRDKPLNTIFRATELLYYTNEAAEEARALDSILNGDAKIFQMGGGTGWLAGYLLQRQPNRRVHAVEPYPEGIDLAQRRLRVLLPPLAEVPTYQPGLMHAKMEIAAGDFDAVVVQAMYYRLGDPAREVFFRRAWDLLKNDRFAYLIMIEPMEGRKDRLMPRALKAIEQAVTRGAPHTEFDAAIVGMFFSGLLGEALTGQPLREPRPVTTAEVVRRAENEGFTLLSQAPSHDGLSDLFIFGKR